MSGDVNLNSAALAEAIARHDFSKCSATVIGFGGMGKQYVKALQSLGVAHIRVCSRSAKPLEELRGVKGVEIVTGGFERLNVQPDSDEIGIVATPTNSLVVAAQHLASLGFRRLLIEKPVSLWSRQIEQLDHDLKVQGADAVCAFNRVAYPGVCEALSRAQEEGGITSCAYTFTELMSPNWVERFSSEELARWGIANSLHVMSMAHALIGLPARWSAFQKGSDRWAWHPAGAVFTGAGVSTQHVPFSYHADWGSTGRWSVEIHTAVSSYRFCPLEKLFRRVAFNREWEEVPLTVFDPNIKVGFVEQVAGMLASQGEFSVTLMSLAETAALTRFGEDVFGYSSGDE